MKLNIGQISQKTAFGLMQNYIQKIDPSKPEELQKYFDFARELDKVVTKREDEDNENGSYSFKQS